MKIVMLVVGNMFDFSMHWECHHPNWLICFRDVRTINQMFFVDFVLTYIDMLILGYVRLWDSLEIAVEKLHIG